MTGSAPMTPRSILGKPSTAAPLRAHRAAFSLLLLRRRLYQSHRSTVPGVTRPSIVRGLRAIRVSHFRRRESRTPAGPGPQRGGLTGGPESARTAGPRDVTGASRLHGVFGRPET